VKNLSLKVPEDLDARLSAVARRSRVSKSSLVRRAIEKMLDADVTAVRGSFLELAGDLVGSVDGPEDLSYNPKYLAGFGK